MDIREYTTRESHAYSYYCRVFPELWIAPPPGDSRQYFYLAAKYIRLGGDRIISPFEATRMAARPDLCASPAVAIFEMFSGQLPEGLARTVAQLVHTYTHQLDRVLVPQPGVMPLYLEVSGPHRIVEPVYEDEDGDKREDEDEDDEDNEMDRALSESAAEIRTVPASRAAIEALEEMKVDSSGGGGGVGTRARARAGVSEDCCDSTCSICFEELILSSSTSPDEHRKVVRMPCSHLYHKDCIVRWLEKSHFCPLCRYAMPTSSS